VFLYIYVPELYIYNGRCDTVVGVVAVLWAGWSGVQFPVEAGEVFLLSKMSRPALGPTQLPVQWVTRVFILLEGGGGVKWPGHVAERSPPSRAEDKSEWSFTSPPPVCLFGMHRYNVITYITCFLPCLCVRAPDR
jgi:hypothetical protein